jgi:hypothetical protein
MARPDDVPSKQAADDQRSSVPPGEPVIGAFVSWAHAHRSWQPRRVSEWRQTVLDFATALRQIGGIDADLDLWHSTSHENWSTFGVTGIRESDFILIAVSRAYRERWEETGPPSEGAGAAREANAIKAIFDRDRSEFRRRVKVVVLPDATVDDIPLELVASTERFAITSFDLVGLTDLLRSLHGRPELIKPPLGRVPALPPTYMAEIAASVEENEGAATGVPERAEGALQRRLSQIEETLTAQAEAEAEAASPHTEQWYDREALRDEREVIVGSLTALQHVASAARVEPRDVPTSSHRDVLDQARSEAAAAIADAQHAMRLLPPIAREALFQYFHNAQPLTVGGVLDRYALEDAIRSEENGYLNWVEDVEQTISPRHDHPRVDAAMTALQRVRNLAFGGVSWESRAQAAPWARLLLRDEYEIEDPEFELRPVWVQLRLIDE